MWFRNLQQSHMCTDYKKEKIPYVKHLRFAITFHLDWFISRSAFKVHGIGSAILTLLWYKILLQQNYVWADFVEWITLLLKDWRHSNEISQPCKISVWKRYDTCVSIAYEESTHLTCFGTEVINLNFGERLFNSDSLLHFFSRFTL